MAKSEQSSTLKFIFLLSLGVLVTIMAYTMFNNRPEGKMAAAELLGVLRPDPKVLKPVTLIDRKGSAFGLDNLRGKWTFIFFGYTNCPDVCPTTLSMLKAVDKHIETSNFSGDTQVLFISVDPARDTPEQLDKYIQFFNPDFLAATGEKSEIDQFAHQLGAGYIIEEETAPGAYQVSHTSAIFLIDPQVRLVGIFSQPHNPETIVGLYYQIRDYFK